MAPQETSIKHSYSIDIDFCCHCFPNKVLLITVKLNVQKEKISFGLNEQCPKRKKEKKTEILDRNAAY